MKIKTIVMKNMLELLQTHFHEKGATSASVITSELKDIFNLNELEDFTMDQSYAFWHNLNEIMTNWQQINRKDCGKIREDLIKSKVPYFADKEE